MSADGLRVVRRVALVGQPNAGKSTLFNAIVGYRAVAANFPGATVEALRGHAAINGRRVEVVDLPGAYSLLGGDVAERVTRDFLLSAGGLNLGVRLLTWPLGLPSETGVPLVLGILRKELSLVMLDEALVGGVAALTQAQMIVFTVFVLFYVPCLATVGALGRELGWRRTGLVVLATTGLGLVLALLARAFLSA